MYIPVTMIKSGKMINYDRCAVRKRQVLYLRSVEHTSIAWMKQSVFLQLCSKYPSIAEARRKIQGYIFSSLIRPYSIDCMAPEKKKTKKNQSSRASSPKTRSVGSQTSVVMRAFTSSNQFSRMNRYVTLTENKLNRFANRIRSTHEGHKGIFKFKNAVVGLIMEYRKMNKVTSFLEKLNIQIEFEQYARLNAYAMNQKPFRLSDTFHKEEEDDSEEDEVQEQRNYILFREISEEIQLKMMALIKQLSQKSSSIIKCNKATDKSLRFLQLTSAEFNFKRRLSSFSQHSEESDGYLTVFEQWLRDNELPEDLMPKQNRDFKEDGETETDSDFWKLDTQTQDSLNQ